jgi:hypothetical protein
MSEEFLTLEEAQQMVQKIIGGRYLVEHAADRGA